MPHALLIDDDPELLAAMTELVKREGFTVATAGSLKEARERLENEYPSLILVDLVLPDGSGIGIFEALQNGERPEVVVISGQATVDSAIDALRLGAVDYLIKPPDISRLKLVLANVARTRALKEEIGTLRSQLRQLGRFGRMIGTSLEMQKVYDLISKVAPTEAAVFITGESGTGKELVAQTLHDLSPRKQQIFLPLNCGAVPPTLIENELFGHERGSFTGATQLHKGHFERASGGTVFLDEITEMPLELQVKLLRVLENRAVMRVGGTQPISVDLRVIAATNRPAEEALAAGKLRQDLYYRLNVFPIVLPPLRNRGSDVMLLADEFLAELNRAEGTDKHFSGSGRARLQTHAWPGNVRELKNEIQRAFIMADDAIDLDTPTQAAAPAVSGDGPFQSIPIGTSIYQAERQLILATLDHCGGDKRKAAAVLGISLKTLYNRLNLYAAV